LWSESSWQTPLGEREDHGKQTVSSESLRQKGAKRSWEPGYATEPLDVAFAR
jgi:hypothetical protein